MLRRRCTQGTSSTVLGYSVLYYTIYTILSILYYLCSEYTDSKKLEEDYAAEEVHPGDLKPALAKALSTILQVSPVAQGSRTGHQCNRGDGV